MWREIRRRATNTEDALQSLDTERSGERLQLSNKMRVLNEINTFMEHNTLNPANKSHHAILMTTCR
jgi:hypothetical protein